MSDVTARRVLLNRLYDEYAADPSFVHMSVRARGVVRGDGPTDPRLMFVGEAPGAQEDKQGRPFVGASGQFLNELLASVGLKREQVFVTNAVKFRPTDGRTRNRIPSDDERWNSLPYLRREHRIVGLPPIVMLGTTAQRAIERLDNRSLKMPLGITRGEWFWMSDGYPVLPLYHPAYGIYQKANRPMMFEMFKAVLSPPVAF